MRPPNPRVKGAVEYVPVPGSEINLATGNYKVVGPARPDGFTSMKIWVRSRAKPGELDAAFIRMAGQTIRQRKYWTHAKLIERFGASPEDLDAIEEYAARFKLCVRRRDPSMQMVELWGRRSDFSEAFRLKWVRYRHDSPSGLPLGRTGAIYVPKYLGEIILRMRDWNDPHLTVTRVRSSSAGKSQRANRMPTKIPRDLTNALWTGKLLAQYYRFPEKAKGKRLDGTGQTIALIELGQGYVPGDVQKYFETLGIQTPTVVAASGDAGKNSWESKQGEVITDIDVVGAVVPGARQVVYFGERATADELLDVVGMAVLDRERNPSVISISWGWPERQVAEHHQHLIAGMGDLFKKAALLGITICVATGDNGSLDLNPQSSAALANPGKLDVDFPACLDASLACGGTWIARGGERVWNEGNGYATGGGISEWVPRPAYQSKARVLPSSEEGFAGRGTPDVSGIAVNFAVIKQCKTMRSRGTSFVAPFWAGLIARLNQASGKRVGFINPILYDHPHVCKSITVGHNDVLNKQPRFTYEAGEGWDPATGLGVPNGSELLKLILEQNG